MKTALIWYTGFVWSNILKQNTFTDLYNSKNISDIKWKEYDLIVCAWVKAVKWWANQNPDNDLEWIKLLINNLKKVKTTKIILISTIDVYPEPIEVNEDFDFINLNKTNHHSYWLNRIFLETFIKNTFSNYSIIRLPWLFWEWLKKNIIYDLLNNNMLWNIIPNFNIQYYYLWNIWNDIKKVISNDLKIVNFNSEPILSSKIKDTFFPLKKIWKDIEKWLLYNYKTKFDFIFWWKNWYMYSKKQIMNQLESFITNYKKWN